MTRDLAPSSKSVANRSCRDQNHLSNLLGSSKFQAVGSPFQPFPCLPWRSSSVTVHIFKLDNAMAADVEEKENASPALEPQPDPKWTGGLLEPEFHLINDAVYSLLGGVSWCIMVYLLPSLAVWQWVDSSFSLFLCISTQLSSYLYLFIYLSIYSHIFILFNFFPSIHMSIEWIYRRQALCLPCRPCSQRPPTRSGA